MGALQRVGLHAPGLAFPVAEGHVVVATRKKVFLGKRRTMGGFIRLEAGQGLCAYGCSKNRAPQVPQLAP